MKGVGLYVVLLSISVILGFVLYGFPDYRRLAWWQLALMDNGQWVILALIGAVVIYGLLAALMLLLLLFAYLLGAVAIMAVTTPIAWTLDRGQPAHPFRLLAFALFLIGFHFDLLTS